MRPVSIGSILLAAGEGKRLRPLTLELPKPAVPILDIPLGAFGLNRLLEVAPPVVVNASHLSHLLKEELQKVCPGNWALLDEGREGFGTAGTLAALADEIDDPVLVHNGDLVTDLDPGAILAT